jgi:hypothetical protein
VIEETRVALVLTHVLKDAPEPSDDNGQFRVEDAWIADR